MFQEKSEVMKYIDAVTKYYNCFLSSGSVKYKGKNKKRVYISGKLSFKGVLTWLLISLIMFFISQSNGAERDFLHFKSRVS